MVLTILVNDVSTIFSKYYYLLKVTVCYAQTSCSIITRKTRNILNLYKTIRAEGHNVTFTVEILKLIIHFSPTSVSNIFKNTNGPVFKFLFEISLFLNIFFYPRLVFYESCIIRLITYQKYLKISICLLRLIRFVFYMLFYSSPPFVGPLESVKR